MPYRSTRFFKNGFYHVYNRGVEKRAIFWRRKDYQTFISILKNYLSKPAPLKKISRITTHQLFDEVTLYAYCLMPNHFHLLLSQKLPDSITQLMRRILTTYSMYFNEKYSRVGTLFQGRFKAKEVESDEYILHLSRYIHSNPLEVSHVRGINDLQVYQWSSYPTYLGREENSLVDKRFILGLLSEEQDQAESYKKFVEYETSLELPESLRFDE